MGLAEWVVLVLLTQQPAHGFAVAQLTASGASVGRIWQVPKAVVYRAIGRLDAARLIRPEGTEHGSGPQRTVFAATDRGRAYAGRWLAQPVRHVRDFRSELLLKLVLLDRAGDDPTALLQAQRAVLEPLVAAIESRRARSHSFDETILAWRRANAVAALQFLDAIMPGDADGPGEAVTPGETITPGEAGGPAGPPPA
jgi:PadR family transcriptional regulator AphA